MDAKLKYKEHMARAASKGLEAVMELRRLRGLSPAYSTTTLHLHCRSSCRLRFQCVDARSQIQSSMGY